MRKAPERALLQRRDQNPSVHKVIKACLRKVTTARLPARGHIGNALLWSRPPSPPSAPPRIHLFKAIALLTRAVIEITLAMLVRATKNNVNNCAVAAVCVGEYGSERGCGDGWWGCAWSEDY